jgi:2,5-diketo-D-gluconate reductase B
MTTIDASMRALEIQGTTVPKLGFGTWQIEGLECQEAAEDSLRNLQVDCLDLLLLHWPDPAFPLDETLGALVGLRDDGLIEHLGVSNFPAGLLREALEIAPVFADQVEFHPFLSQDEIVELAPEKDFMVTTYSPLARGKVPADPTLNEIGEAHGKTAGQVALRWLLDKPQVCAITKASSHERRVENFEVFDFERSDEERARIEVLPKDERIIDPGFGPDWDA